MSVIHRNLFLVQIFLFLYAQGAESIFQEKIIFPAYDDTSHLTTGLSHLDLSTVPRARGAIGEENVLASQKKALEKIEAALVTSRTNEPEIIKSPSLYGDVDQALQKVYEDKDLVNKEISLQTKEINIRDLVDTIGKAIGINLMVDPRVKGALGSLNLKKCGAGEALQLICKQAQPEAALVKTGKVWHITTREDARNMLKDALKEYEQEKELQIFPISNANIDDDFKEKVKKGWQHISNKDKDSYVHFDESDKKVYAKGGKKQLQEFHQYLKAVDKPVLQVRLDVIVVLASRDFYFDFGIDWSGIYNREETVRAKGKAFDFYGLGGTLLDFPNPADDNSQTAKAPSPVVPAPPNGPNRHNPNLFVNPLNWAINLFNSGLGFYSADATAASTAGLIRIPFIFGGPDLSLRRLNLVLNMAETEEKVNIITRPSILTSNNKKAAILIGQSLPLQTTIEDTVASTTRNITTINYKEVGIMLEVKPIVSPNRKSVYLDILVVNSVVDSGSTEANATGIMQNPPTISVIKTKNEVVLKNGQTTIIGGLSSKQTGSKRRSVPFFANIPVLGQLFRSSLDATSEKERYIFITPKIIEYEP